MRPEMTTLSNLVYSLWNHHQMTVLLVLFLHAADAPPRCPYYLLSTVASTVCMLFVLAFIEPGDFLQLCQSGSGKNKLGHILYVRDSDDEGEYDSDEDPDDDLDI